MADEQAGATLDVAAILAAVRSEIRTQRAARGTPADAALARELQTCLDELELQRVVSAHWPISGTTLPQKALAFVNKLVRRGLRWYINPIVEQQNAYNDAVARTLRLLAEAYSDLAQQLDDLGNPHSNDQPPPDSPTATHQPVAPPVPPIATSAAQLQALVRARAANEPPAHFADLELRALVPQLGLRRVVQAHWPLEARNWLERLAALAHQLQRRYLRWLINPIVAQQNAANAAIYAALLAAIRRDAAQRASIAARRARQR